MRRTAALLAALFAVGILLAVPAVAQEGPDDRYAPYDPYAPYAPYAPYGPYGPYGPYVLSEVVRQSGTAGGEALPAAVPPGRASRSTSVVAGQEITVGMLLVAFGLGAGAVLVLTRRRRRQDDPG